MSRGETTRVMWERGIERGELDSSIDIDIAMDLVYGPVMFRIMTGHAPLNDREAKAIVEAAFAGLTNKAAGVDAEKKRKIGAGKK